MKNILIIILSLFAANLFAQKVTKDTSYLIWQDGAFYEARDIQYTPVGRNLNINPTAIGDTAQTKQFILAQYINLNQEVGGAAVSYILGSRVLKAKVRDLKNLYASIGGITLEKATRDYFYPGFEGQGRVLSTFRFVMDGANQGSYELFQRQNESLRLRQVADNNIFYSVERRSDNTMILEINSVPVPVFKLGANDKGKTVWEDITGKYRLVEQ
jgi:hypothetical protein